MDEGLRVMDSQMSPIKSLDSLRKGDQGDGHQDKCLIDSLDFLICDHTLLKMRCFHRDF